MNPPSLLQQPALLEQHTHRNNKPNQFDKAAFGCSELHFHGLHCSDFPPSDRIKAMKVMGLQPPAPPSLQTAGFPRGLQGVNNAARTKAAPTPGTRHLSFLTCHRVVLIPEPCFLTHFLCSSKGLEPISGTTKAVEILPSQSSLKLLSMNTWCLVLTALRPNHAHQPCHPFPVQHQTTLHSFHFPLGVTIQTPFEVDTL